ncbi:L-histidine N(alpha)-methyltransferase [Planomonospora parontospora]|uniref:L-histidine N(alpha)-methyltransferase n=1 Tax=Planomonospora parontospora TaxID=58119 RepID=UPI00167044E6|nr:L-histidine N(alpha)-methyltransferase [Planomonospora parontospora]GGL14815.1 histidine N-alpha-methyltransferase [Planomonospora parontospora subsp. antibiotica]GII15870.1 histidine N-alpha-methyltransferase [Planomonospora parontospora subsp. antibiotica]
MSEPVVEYHLTPDDLAKSLRRDVYDGLAAAPRTLPPKWFYDERGSGLFEEITRLEEYYLTRAEKTILRGRAAEVAAATGADTLIELGAGSGEKTRLLLGALRSAGTLRRYVPVDVSGDFLAASARRIGAEYPGLSVRAVVADFERHLDVLPDGGRRLVAFLGSTVGNLSPAERRSFYGGLRAVLGPGDSLLLGFDLVKDPARLLAAYDDAQGVTAEFNRNVLRVVNRELGADFVPEAFEHVAVWDAEAEWMEMRLRSATGQRVRIPDLELELDFAAGEEIRTEISAKFRPAGVRAELEGAGFAVEHWWTDPPGDFALCVAGVGGDPGAGEG